MNNTRLKILLAGRAAEPAEELEIFMAQRGWSWEYVREGGDLLTALQQRSFDVIIIDTLLPHIDPQAVRDVVLHNLDKPPRAFVLCEPGSEDAFAGFSDFPGEYCRGAKASSILQSLAASSENDEEPNAEVSAFHEATSYRAADVCGITPELPILDELLAANLIDTGMKQRLLLAFQEAFTNALEHGSLELISVWKDQFDAQGNDLYTSRKKERLANPQYAERRVAVHSQFDGKSLMIRIQDQGPGFSLGTTRETLLTNTPASFHGRGLTIIGSIMDEVTFGEDGSEILMVKYLG